MGSRYELRLSGSGGQGLILAGVILAEAAAIYDGKNAVQSQSYGPEARGGASKSEVIISNDEIDYPKATNINFLLALTQKSCDAYSQDVLPGGTVLVDSELVTDVPERDYTVYKLPIIDIAKNKIGKLLVANIVALGALVALTNVVSYASIESAVLARVPRGTEELNRRALKEGYTVAQALLG
ncbi:2-oxoacid:acceptor oxidoreductase family protein [bacterium]|nr:2-oxoacid:acceptor oxidoreductase family protein [bacterium]